ncbi:MAG TPA: twin-arginine translocase subunit TatC [Chthoniobacter sp.]|jgi:sec-independent protein translocase protein TatC
MFWLRNWLKKVFTFREKSQGDVVKPFLDHMEDLRWVLIRILLTLVICMAITFGFVHQLMHLLEQPMLMAAPDMHNHIITAKITDPFVISLLLAFFAGIVLALPFLSYFVLSFILPALTRKEKKFLFPGIAASFCLFLSGVLISYYYILPKTLRFFYDYARQMHVTPLWDWKDYISFCAWMSIGFGLLCQLPVVMVALAFVGIIDFRFLSTTRPYAITGILVLAAIVAPTPDPVTFMTLSVPIILLYEVCIWIVWLIDRSRKKAAALNEGQTD